jgi:hypothetical protein
MWPLIEYLRRAIFLVYCFLMVRRLYRQGLFVTVLKSVALITVMFAAEQAVLIVSLSATQTYIRRQHLAAREPPMTEGMISNSNFEPLFFASVYVERVVGAPGRPAVPPDVRALIRTSEASPLWGAPRIHGELLKLGINVSQAADLSRQSR